MELIIDSNGFISLGGDARYELSFLDLGIAADIGGSGAYSTTSDRFNIEAHATGQLLLGFLGAFDVVRFGAVVSDTGWGTCGNLPGLLFLVKAGIGQNWERDPKLILGCDLSPFSSNVSGARAAGSDPGAFVVGRGVKRLGIEARADGPEPQLELVDPRGRVVAATAPLGRRVVDRRVALIAQPGQSKQYLFVRAPMPGEWRLRQRGGDARLTRVRVARDVERLAAREVSVTRVAGRPGRRLVRVRGLRGFVAGERVAIGVRTPRGVQPLGTTGGSRFGARYHELGRGRRAIVATVLRGGIPLPARTRAIARHRASLPQAPRAVRARRKGPRVVARAVDRRGAEEPGRWQYVLRSGRRSLALKRANPGRPARFRVSPQMRGLTVAVRPVVRGRALRGAPRVARVTR
jgi:hypothetical protein